MDKLMRKFITVLALIFTTNFSVAQAIPFPTDFTAVDFYYVEDGYVGVYGYYEHDKKKYFSIIWPYESNLKSGKWHSSAFNNKVASDSLKKVYYNQLFTYKPDQVNEIGYYFDVTLNYIYKRNFDSDK